MSALRGAELGSAITLIMDDDAPISLRALRSYRMASLEIGRGAFEIQLTRAHLKSLRDQLPDVLAVLDKEAADSEARAAAGAASKQAAKASDEAYRSAREAEASGARELSAFAMGASEWARSAAAVADAAAITLLEAVDAADNAADAALAAVALIDQARQIPTE
jgi:hypothetical protein